MKKKMVKFEWNPFSVFKQNHVVVKFVTISLLYLSVVAFHSLYSYYFQVIPFLEAPVNNGAEIQAQNPQHQVPPKGNHLSRAQYFYGLMGFCFGFTLT